jgi:UDP-glucose 4-epimerase
MRIGVTGATGFIGKHLISELEKHGPVISLPRLKGVPNRKDLKKFVSGTDLIFHLGGVNRATDEEILKGNTIATSRLLEVILKHGKSSARLIFASSSQVYPAGSYNNPIRETKRTSPNSVYDISKRSAEDLIKVSGVRSTILRMSNVYGPGCLPYYNSVIATWCYRTIKGLPLVINGGGRQGRDFIYVKDAVRAFMLAGFNSGTDSGKIFNVSSGKLVSMKQVIKNITRFQKNTKTEFLQGNQGADISYCCDASKILKRYGWKPRFTLSHGIEKTLSYYREGKIK